MKFSLPFLFLIILFSCENPVEKSNERIKSLILKKSLEISDNYSQYKNDISDSKFETLLNIDRIKNDNNHEQSNVILKKAEAILTSFNQNNKKLVSEIRVLLDSVKPTEKIRLTEIDKLKIEFNESVETTRTNFVIDSTILDLNKKIIHLIDKNCKYKIVDNQIRFFDINCMNNYNFYYTTLETKIMLEKFNVIRRKIK